ncbi:hypothetical protein BU17DRAFT_80809 [Hysterangium stoloniferum]|nr:hypothetical protein BU17DRAFT_80809 [Hysterangium stoloniferum]
MPKHISPNSQVASGSRTSYPVHHIRDDDEDTRNLMSKEGSSAELSDDEESYDSSFDGSDEGLSDDAPECHPTLQPATGTRVSRDYYPLPHHQAYFDEYEASHPGAAPPGDGYNLTNLQDGKPNSKGRPPHGHRFVVACAIYGAPEGKLTLPELYLALERRYRWYADPDNVGWKNNVRHALSHCEEFQRVDGVRDGVRTSWWKWSPGFGPPDIAPGARAGKHKRKEPKPKPKPKPVEAKVATYTSIVSRGRNPKKQLWTPMTLTFAVERAPSPNTATECCQRIRRISSNVSSSRGSSSGDSLHSQGTSPDTEERHVSHATEERHPHRFAPYPKSPHGPSPTPISSRGLAHRTSFYNIKHSTRAHPYAVWNPLSTESASPSRPHRLMDSARPRLPPLPERQLPLQEQVPLPPPTLAPFDHPAAPSRSLPSLQTIGLSAFCKLPAW